VLETPLTLAASSMDQPGDDFAAIGIQLESKSKNDEDFLDARRMKTRFGCSQEVRHDPSDNRRNSVQSRSTLGLNSIFVG